MSLAAMARPNFAPSAAALQSAMMGCCPETTPRAAMVRKVSSPGMARRPAMVLWLPTGVVGTCAEVGSSAQNRLTYDAATPRAILRRENGKHQHCLAENENRRHQLVGVRQASLGVLEAVCSVPKWTVAQLLRSLVSPPYTPLRGPNVPTGARIRRHKQSKRAVRICRLCTRWWTALPLARSLRAGRECVGGSAFNFHRLLSRTSVLGLLHLLPPSLGRGTFS